MTYEQGLLLMLAGVCFGTGSTMAFLRFKQATRLRPAPVLRPMVADPSGMRARFFDIPRSPLEEITEKEARALRAGGRRVFAHPFDPIEIDYFDLNGFQCWAIEGYRFEGVRFYLKPLPGDHKLDNPTAKGEHT